MGTITITEYSSAGGPGAFDGSPFLNLSASIKTTTDASTTIAVESITLHPDTRYITVEGAQKHRFSVNDSLCTTNYTVALANVEKDTAVNKDDRTLYYRLDA